MAVRPPQPGPTVTVHGGGNAALAFFKTDKSTPGNQLLNKSGFPALPRTQKADNGRIA